MPFSVFDILRSSLNDLRRFPLMLVPLLAASIVLFFVLTLLAGAGVITGGSLQLGGTSYTLLFIVSVLLTVAVEFVAFGVLVCLAYDVVISGVSDLAGGFSRFRERLLPLLVIALAITVSGVVLAQLVILLASALGGLAIVAAVVPVMLLVLLALFATIASVYDESGPAEAFRSAWSLLFSNLAVMLLFAMIMFVLFMLLGLVSSVLSLTPLVGNIISSLLLAAYYSLVVDAGMRFYRQLSA